MTMSSSEDHPLLPTTEARPTWTATFEGVVRNLALSREAGWILARDDTGWLTLLDERGKRQAQRQASHVVAIDSADNGSAFVVGDSQGMVYWLAPDLMPRWERRVTQPVAGLAIDAHGQLLAVSDTRGELTLFSKSGRTIWTVQLPRALEHLRFGVEKPMLIGSADFGLVVALDREGQIVWQDRLVSHVGSLDVSGDLDVILLACFSDGLWKYAAKGPTGEQLATKEPCQLLSLSYSGGVVLASGLRKRFSLLDLTGRVLGEQTLEASVTAMKMGATADYAVLGLSNGRLFFLQWR